jgi:hypothetical protein
MRGIDDSYTGTPAQLLNAQILEAATKMGLDFTHSSRYKQYMEAAGFVDVTVRHFQWPMGPWAKGRHMKILGLGFQQDILGGVEGLALAMLTRTGVRTAEQVRVELVGVRKTIMDRNVHAYMPGYVVFCFLVFLLAERLGGCNDEKGSEGTIANGFIGLWFTGESRDFAKCKGRLRSSEQGSSCGVSRTAVGSRVYMKYY